MKLSFKTTALLVIGMLTLWLFASSGATAEDEKRSGPILLWGGGFEKISDWKAFLELCPNGPVVVVTDASAKPNETFAAYKKLFSDTPDRETVQWSLAQKPPMALQKAGAVFLCGGKQMRLVEALRQRKESGEELRSAHEAGVGIFGTSAGAMFLSSQCITGRKTDDGWEVVEGLGIFEGMCETHFFREGRAKRLRDCARMTDPVHAYGIPAGNGVLLNADGDSRAYFSAYKLLLD